MIEVRALRKSFGRLTVVDSVDLVLEKGKVTAVLGPNAAGKTTLLKCILGLVKPDAGQIVINGSPVDGDCRYRASIGYMPQTARFPEHLTGGEIINFLIALRDFDGTLDKELLEVLGLEDQLQKPVRSLSDGTRQKISAVIAWLFRPSVLILDEPTAGLDPRASSALKDKILTERDRDRTIVLTSHIMSEVEELADHVIFLDSGKVAFEGSAATLRDNTGEVRLERAIAQMMTATAP